MIELPYHELVDDILEGDVDTGYAQQFSGAAPDGVRWRQDQALAPCIVVRLGPHHTTTLFGLLVPGPNARVVRIVVLPPFFQESSWWRMAPWARM